MPLSLRRGRVTRVVDARCCEVEGAPCVVYADLTGPVEEGDEVLVNVQARELGLGSGGFDVLYANLTRGLDLEPDHSAHVMALPYAPGQWAVRHAEEDGELADSLDGLPVVLCTVHSQVAPVWAALRELRVAYVQVAGGALPLELSDTVRTLGFAARISVAPCFGGDARCVSVASALLWAASRAAVAICSVGPGIVGTGTHFGHGAVSLAEAANVSSALGGVPILAARVSDADGRERHRGVSHHTQAVLELCLGEVELSSPDDGAGWREACAGLPLSHMGRGPDEEPSHFAAAYAAGRLAAERVR
ncbi:MAG: hypothetical protein QOH95_1480 [Gaiellaceae bacterium]|jgi:hypothetical protein|nr:hypothetical protein [Gaiellaceae bacterium]